MTIYGVSQSNGLERRLNVERGGQGIVLIITNHIGGKEAMRILVQADNLLPVIMEPPVGGAVVEGISPPNGPKMLLDVEVRRNEVWLRRGRRWVKVRMLRWGWMIFRTHWKV